MNNFKYWLDEIADMPTKDENGKWFDLEDGSYFDENTKYIEANTPSESVSNDAKIARKRAKKLGGVALTGTIKQKNWAEVLRENVLYTCEDAAAKVSLATNKIFNNAAFWIAARNKKHEEMHKLPYLVNNLILKANELLQSAEAEIKTNEKNIIIQEGNYVKIMQEREIILKKLSEIKKGIF